MEDYHQLKLKRKDLDDVNDDFSDFSLSPARKIRRLDAELPPIIEDVDCEMQTLLPEQRPTGDSPCHVRIEELPSSEDKAIVLFKPGLSLSVDPCLISALKNQDMRSIQPIPWRLTEGAVGSNNSGSGNGCMAIVPWVPSKFPPEAATEFPSQSDNSEMMDVQEVEEGEGMDVEDGDTEQRNVNGVMLTEGFNQWQQQQQQQQHCLIPQPPYNATAQVVWYQ